MRRFRNFIKKRWKLLALVALIVIALTSKAGIKNCVTTVNLDVCEFLGKKAWEWLELLIAPGLLAAIGIVTNQYFKDRDAQRLKQERKIAEDKERQDALKQYFKEMTELLLSDDWPERYGPDEGPGLYMAADGSVDTGVVRIVAVARAKTLAILRELDGERKASVVKFLQESASLGLITLKAADLKDARLESIDFSGANLRGVYLMDADLREADLCHTCLIKSYLSRASLRKANLSSANLSDAILIGTKFNEANLSEANLSGVNLTLSDLTMTNLSGANLSGAFCLGSNFDGADLTRVIVANTKFRRVKGLDDHQKAELVENGATFDDFYDVVEDS